MKMLTRVGDVYGADRLVPIASAHVLAHYGSLHDAGITMMEKFASAGGVFAVPTSVNPASIDLENWRRLGFPEGYARKQLRLCRAYASMKGLPSWSCIHYQYCNTPRFGECLAWCESSAVCFANSVIGARTNRLAAGLDVACAILGVTPRFGLLLKENRRGNVRIKLTCKLRDDFDYQRLGYIIGKRVGNKIPVFEGIPPSVTPDQLKCLGAAAASSGALAMFHAVSITPEAPTITAAFEGERPEDRWVIGPDDLKTAEEELNLTDEKPDLIALGGPQYSMAEIIRVAAALSGKRVKPGVRVWLYTAKYFERLAEDMNLKRTLLAAGAKFSTSTCAEIEPLEDLGVHCVMTPSAKFANSIAADHQIGVRFASLAECVRAAAER